MTLAETSLHRAPGSVTIWNPNATANWSLPFTPAFGSYLQMLNWKALGESERAKSSNRWFYVSIAMLFLYVLIGLVIPDEKAADLASRGLAFWFLIIWYFASARSQAMYVKERYGTTYSRQPWGKALLYAVGGLVAYVVVAFVMGLIIGVARMI